MTLKLIFVQLILCFTIIHCCYGQTNQLINIPVVKENASVDSVLDKFLAKRPISLEKLSRLGGEYSDDVKVLLRDACFYYKGYNVFVWTRNSFGWLFSKTDRTQTYGFIYYAGKDQTYPKMLIQDGIDYQFKNGTFSDRGAPTIITKKGNR